MLTKELVLAILKRKYPFGGISRKSRKDEKVIAARTVIPGLAYKLVKPFLGMEITSKAWKMPIKKLIKVLNNTKNFFGKTFIIYLKLHDQQSFICVFYHERLVGLFAGSFIKSSIRKIRNTIKYFFKRTSI